MLALLWLFLSSLSSSQLFFSCCQKLLFLRCCRQCFLEIKSSFFVIVCYTFFSVCFIFSALWFSFPILFFFLRSPSVFNCTFASSLSSFFLLCSSVVCLVFFTVFVSSLSSCFTVFFSSLSSFVYCVLQ